MCRKGWAQNFVSWNVETQACELQNYYGIAIRSNVGNLAGMKKAIHPSLRPCASSESRLLHDHCPSCSTSWCRYQQDRANKTRLYKHGAGLALPVISKLKSEYVRPGALARLSDDSLLEKCLHGKRQNMFSVSFMLPVRLNLDAGNFPKTHITN